MEAVLTAEDLEAPVSSGTSLGSGEYFSRVGVGSPSKEYFMVIDTGSDVSWLQCQPCSDCYQQSDPIYTPSSSSTYSPLTCSTRECSTLEVSACRNSACLYQVSYGDGSYTVGEFVTETVSFGTSGKIPKVAIGCGHDNEGLFVGAAGLLGLGGGPLSLPSQIKATSFSYCLVDRDSPKSSSLEFNSAKPADCVTAPLIKNNKLNTFYYVGLSGFSVGGQQISVPPTLFDVDEGGSGGVIVDSGTAITRLPTQAYNSLRTAFTRLTPHLKSTTGVALFDTCYDFSSMSSVKVPTVAFHFAGGQSLDLPAKNYLIPVDSAGTYCFAFAETTSSMSIIGNVQQQGIRVHYDLARSQVAFSPNNC
uniref:Peptidase A1 domain-containing protein n=2 Tax=Chenopodium quinoa TaxID=63459 RepID=A0A803LI50_CHEQI